MRDPYLYEEVDTLRNLLGITNATELQKLETDMTYMCMNGIYNYDYQHFDTEVLKEIHLAIFGRVYDWAGEYRTIHISKQEVVLGGSSVEYSSPKLLDKELRLVFKELDGVVKGEYSDKERVFRLTRIISRIWHIHPFREGNTRTVIVLATLIGKSLGYDVNHEIFHKHAAYVRNALVWCTQGIYSKYEYLETIFYDAILGEMEIKNVEEGNVNKYDMIGDYRVKDYVPMPHQYIESDT